MELTVDRLGVDIRQDLVSGLPRPTVTRFAIATTGGEQTATRQAVAVVEQVHPGATDIVVDLVEALRDKAAVADATGDEAEIAARHGATHLALAVVVSTAVLRSLGVAAVAGRVSRALHVTGRDSAVPQRKAASLYWNVNADFRLTAAERGELLFAGHPGREPGAPHTEDLGFDDFRHRKAKGLAVIARFTVTPHSGRSVGFGRLVPC